MSGVPEPHASEPASGDRRRLPRDFHAFFAGQTISQLGSSFTNFAIPLLIFKLTGSSVNLGIATAAVFLPYLMFGLVIGAYVDRVNRKRMMIVVDIARAAVIATIPLMAALGVLSVWWIYGVGFLSSTLTIFFEAGEFAAIPSLVGMEDLVTANGRIQASYSAAAIAGPLLAGLLVAFFAVQEVLLVDASSFLISAATLATIGRAFNSDEERERTSIRSDVVEGLRYVLSNPVLRNISLMMAMVNFVGSTTYAQLVLFAKHRLDATDVQVGLLFSGGSLGVVVFGLAAGPLRKRLSFGTVALGALMISGVLTVALSLTRAYWLALPIWTIIGGLGILFNINTGSLRQAIVPNHLLGRVISIAGVLAWSAIPLGTLLGGFVIRWTGSVALVYGVIGGLTVLIPAVFWFSPLGHAEQYVPIGGSIDKEVGAVQ